MDAKTVELLTGRAPTSANGPVTQDRRSTSVLPEPQWNPELKQTIGTCEPVSSCPSSSRVKECEHATGAYESNFLGLQSYHLTSYFNPLNPPQSRLLKRCLEPIERQINRISMEKLLLEGRLSENR